MLLLVQLLASETYGGDRIHQEEPHLSKTKQLKVDIQRLVIWRQAAWYELLVQRQGAGGIHVAGRLRIAVQCSRERGRCWVSVPAHAEVSFTLPTMMPASRLRSGE